MSFPERLVTIIVLVVCIVSCKMARQTNSINLGQSDLDSIKSLVKLETKKLKPTPDDIAPDGSRIYLLPGMKGGGMCLAELPPRQTTQAVSHKTVEEIWFFLSGKGEVWRKMNGDEEVTEVSKDISITIPLGCHFQFRNTGEEPLRFIIGTMPPWPGPVEAFEVNNYWDVEAK